MRTLFHTRAFLVVLLFLLASCSAGSFKTIVSENCQFESVHFDSDFPAGRLSFCEQSGENQYDLFIEPESKPAHHSPWYAFRVTSEQEKRITVRLRYTEKAHRYPPKVSVDKHNWSALNAKQVSESNDGSTARLRLDVGPKPLYVAGQEIIDNNHYELWGSHLAKRPDVTRTKLGVSEQGRPIFKLETTSSDSGKYLVLVGRQHPPEVTGALAMFSFIQTLMADTPLANKFRRDVNLLIVPNLNPDGVELGHWRKNTNGIDLNRDWGPFTQAETRVMRDELHRFNGGNSEQMLFFLDFHSTNKDVFYTLPEELPGNPASLIKTWLDAVADRLPENSVRQQPGYSEERYISKNYIYKTFGVPAITYELGDNTERPYIKQQATIAAEEMMKTLLSLQMK